MDTVLDLISFMFDHLPVLYDCSSCNFLEILSVTMVIEASLVHIVPTIPSTT